jgi:toxin CcdB
VVIRQFDVFTNPSTISRRIAPYVVALQSEYAGDLETVVVAPLLLANDLPSLTQMMVKVDLDGITLIASMPELAAINRRSLRSRIGNLLAYEDDIRRALDRLFTGF